LKQDEDVMDTWFSSWLWPISVFDGFYKRNELDYYYPTNDLVTGPDIIFFWVARMIMAGYEFEGKAPFKNVYFTGIIRDKLGRKMSKSLGNSPDPIDLIEQYSADGVRLGLLMTAPAGNDIPFDDAICEQGRNFTNKIWNALRLVKSWSVEEGERSEASVVAAEWMNTRISDAIHLINDHYDKYRLNDAAMAVYKLIWDDFCAWYLEAIKPAYGAPIDRETLDVTISFFEQLMILLHPMMPFITEEIWEFLKPRKAGDLIIKSHWPTSGGVNQDMLSAFGLVKQITTELRAMRAQKGISPKEKLMLCDKGSGITYLQFLPVLEKLANVELHTNTEVAGPSASFIVGTLQFAVELEGYLDEASERIKLEEELAYQKGFLQSVLKKLSNEKFVSGAPEAVVGAERKKQADAELRIRSIEEKLKTLK
jgi:valyl-tRNA synthetase